MVSLAAPGMLNIDAGRDGPLGSGCVCKPLTNGSLFSFTVEPIILAQCVLLSFSDRNFQKERKKD